MSDATNKKVVPSVSLDAKSTESTSDIPSVDIGAFRDMPKSELTKIDDATKNSIESDQDYRQITKTIIDHTATQLDKHTSAKSPLRMALLIFVISLLSLQFIVLALILFFKSLWGLAISDFVINVYIVSLFVETLAGLIIMIKFAFDSEQEIKLISILNSIVVDFKKYKEDSTND